MKKIKSFCLLSLFFLCGPLLCSTKFLAFAQEEGKSLEKRNLFNKSEENKEKDFPKPILEKVKGIEFLKFPSSIQKTTLKIGVFDSAPFSFVGPEGKWKGLAIDLWETIATSNDIAFEYIPLLMQPIWMVSTEDIITSARKGFDEKECDIIIWPIPDYVTEGTQDFIYTLPYHAGGLSIAVRNSNKLVFDVFFSNILSPTFLKICFFIFLYLFIGGFCFWFFEKGRHGDPHMRSQPFYKGIRHGLWWASATLSTVGCSDYSPQTTKGRMFGAVWLFLCALAISSFTAEITSIITVEKLSMNVNNKNDLRNMRVVTQAGSTAEVFLRENYIPYKEVSSIDEGLKLVEDNKADVYFGPDALIRYYVNKHYPTLKVIGGTFVTEYYSFIVNPKLGFLKPLSQQILKIINSPLWKDILYNYLGALPYVHI